MKSFVKAGVILAALQGALATPVPKGETNFWWPGPYNYNTGSMNASGANGGHNYGGDGANGGSINVGRQGNGPVNAYGANGGTNTHGSGANGGRISVGRRAEEASDFLWPFWPFDSIPPTNGDITASGANGGTNRRGNGANGGGISINGRGEEAEETSDFLFPFFRYPRPSTNSAISATGANGGFNYRGNGANGGSISVGRRAEEMGDFWPIWNTYQPANGPVTASGANGGTNYYGNGANGGRISVNRRGEEAEKMSDFFWPFWSFNSPPASGPINANGAEGGYNYGGDGANGGTISISGRDEEAEEMGDFLLPWGYYPTNRAITANGANGGTNYYGNGANGGRIAISH